MIHAFLLLILLQLCGDVVAAELNLPIPGMVIGLAALLGWFVLRGRRLGREQAVPADLGAVAESLQANLGLLFIPAGVGVLAYADLLAVEGPIIVISVLVSTLIGIATGAAIAAWRLRTQSPTVGSAP